jgi:putative endopeptidase
MPAAIFTVPGLRDEELDDALVYGYAGATTIGHEITHGFDDEGRQYDEKGNLTNWWTKEDERKFNERAQLMVRQYGEYIPVDTLRINGKATLGENIADLGGAVLALDAFKKTQTYKEGKVINGMTPLQRFFRGFALGWLGHMRKEALANQLLTDVHAPEQYRVNGPFVNMKEFYEAYDIKPGSKMYRPDSLRVSIW